MLSTVKRNKWRWAGHLGRTIGKRWSNLTTEWQPLYGKRKRGSPQARGRDEILNYLRSTTWTRSTEIGGTSKGWRRPLPSSGMICSAVAAAAADDDEVCILISP